MIVLNILQTLGLGYLDITLSSRIIFCAVNSKLMCMDWDRSLLVNSENSCLILASVGVQKLKMCRFLRLMIYNGVYGILAQHFPTLYVKSYSTLVS